MDTNEVIVINETNDTSLNDKSSIKENVSVSSNTEDIYSICDKSIECTTETDRTTNKEKVTGNDVVELPDYNEKNKKNEEQILFNNLSGNKNEVFMDSSFNKTDAEKHLSIESLKQNDNDIAIMYDNTMELSDNVVNNKISSLTAIAVEYGNSDSEAEDNSDYSVHENEQTTVAKDIPMQSYRTVNISSSSEESDSEDDSTTSSSVSSVIAEANESDSDESTNKKTKENNTKGRKNNEIRSELDDLPPIEDLKISVPEVLCDPLGEVAWMVEQLVVVRPKPDKPTLNLDTVLFVEKGQRALGKVFDVFGQVNEPYYCVRFNSAEHIKESDIKVGMTVYYCPNTEYTSLVFLHELMKIKGIDVTADEPPEFSDDEEERAYYEQLKTKQANNGNDTDVPYKRKRAKSPTSGWQSNHPWNRNAPRHRKGHNPRGNYRQFSAMQPANQSQNVWGYPYQNNWSAFPRHMYPEGNVQYGYGTYPTALQSMQYGNPSVNNSNQNFYAPQNYYSEDGTSAPVNSRFPFNTCPNQPNSSQNLRFRNPDMSWQQMPQVPIRTNTPWVSLPPPPPPPPPSSSSSSSAT